MKLTIVLLSYLISCSICCNCPPQRSFERQVCESDFVARVEVRSPPIQLEYSDASYYRIVVVSKPYKRNNWTDKALSRGRLFTNSSDCGRDLVRGRVYVVSGTVDRYHNPWTSECQFSQLYDGLNRQQKHFLKRDLRSYRCSVFEDGPTRPTRKSLTTNETTITTFSTTTPLSTTVTQVVQDVQEQTVNTV